MTLATIAVDDAAAGGGLERATEAQAFHVSPPAATALWRLAGDERCGAPGLLASLVALLARRYTRQDEIDLRISTGAGEEAHYSLELRAPCTLRALLRGARACRPVGSQWRPGAHLTIVVPDVIAAQLRRPGRPDADPDAGAAMRLTCVPSETGLDGSVVVPADHFARDTVARLCEHLGRLAGAAAAAPDTDVDRLAMLGDDEQRQIVNGSGTPAVDEPGSCVQDVFEAVVAHAPTAPALRWARRTVTFDELNRRANRLARVLRARGIGPETAVGVCLADPIQTVVSLLAVLKAGGVYLPLNPTEPRPRLAEMIADSRPALVIASDDLRNTCPLDAHRVLSIDDEAILASADTNLPRNVTPDNATHITYTSGSTGVPKGVVGVHRSVTGAVRWSTPFRPDEVCCVNVSLSFASAVLGVLMPLLRGRPTVIIAEDETKNLTQLVDAWESAGVTRVVLVAPQLRQLLALGPSVTSRLRTVTTIALSGAALTADLAAECLAELPQARLINAYISTESGTPATRRETTAASVQPGASIGRPVANVAVQIVDRGGNPVPVGVAGELCIATADGARGYLHRPALTAERFVPNPFAAGVARQSRLYRTGDLCRYRADGEIEYLGRTDDQVKIRGIRVEPGEIEAALKQLPDVADATVIAHEVDGRARLVAYVVSRHGALRVSAIRESLAASLPGYMVPGAFLVLDRLPLTPRGKVDRAALPRPDPTRPELDSPYVPPRTPLERALVDVWTRVLRVDQVGVHDHFLELGGDSLVAVHLVSELQRLFAASISVLGLLDRPTVAMLAETIDAAVRAAAAAKVGER